MRIPVSVIGGYLGAGKTTSLNHLLATHHGLRLSVLVNDFGSVNIDASLIAAHEGDTIALTNGCVCCSIADDLGTTLEAQMNRGDPPDHIVVEASGVADPAKIARLAGNWPGCRLAGIAVLADASTLRQRSMDKFVGTLVQQQLRAADRIFLNKTDLVGPEDLESIRNWLSETVPDTPASTTAFGALPVSDLLFEGKGMPVGASTTAPHGLSSFIWRPAEPVDTAALAKVLATEPVIHRAKGTVRLTTGWQMLQWSGGDLDVTTTGGSGFDSALVFVGPFQDGDRARLLHRFETCTKRQLPTGVAAG